MKLKAHYNNGTVTFYDDVLPKVEADIDIEIPSPEMQHPNSFSTILVSEHPACGIWRDRTDIADSAEYVAQQRASEEGRGRST